MHYDIESLFWLKLIGLILGMVIVLSLFNALMRKVLKVKKKKMFSSNYVNPLHKKLDQITRGVFLLFLIVGSLYNISRIPLDPILALEPYVVLAFLIISTELLRAYMEWKYAENVNDYKYTLVTLAFAILVTGVIFYAGFQFWFE